MEMELIEEYIESFDSLSADEYFEEMKLRIEQDDGVPIFLLAVKYECESRLAEAEEFYSSADITVDEAYELEHFLTENVTRKIDFQKVLSKLFKAILVEPNEVELLWEFKLPDEPSGKGAPYALQSISVWERWWDDGEADWFFKWYYPMARQQGMPEITWDSLISYCLLDVDTHNAHELEEHEASLRESIVTADMNLGYMIDEFLTDLFIQKGGSDDCRIRKGMYERDPRKTK